VLDALVIELKAVPHQQDGLLRGVRLDDVLPIGLVPFATVVPALAPVKKFTVSQVW
jgi:hypothetical protein